MGAGWLYGTVHGSRPKGCDLILAHGSLVGGVVLSLTLAEPYGL